MEDIRMNLKDYEDSLRGGLNDEEDIKVTIEEMKEAKVGTIKANCWEKVAADEYVIFSM